jgi:hypothetical protein
MGDLPRRPRRGELEGVSLSLLLEGVEAMVSPLIGVEAVELLARGSSRDRKAFVYS